VDAVIAIILGLAAAVGGGVVSALRVGGEALGREAAAFVGVFYGLLAGGPAVAAGVVVLLLS